MNAIKHNLQVFTVLWSTSRLYAKRVDRADPALYVSGESHVLDWPYNWNIALVKKQFMDLLKFGGDSFLQCKHAKV